MWVKTVQDEDFVNYKEPSMFIAFPCCTWKCEKECGMQVCQNGPLATASIINVDINIIIETLQEMLPEGDPRKELVSTDLITYVEDRKGHDRRYAIAPDKIKAEIGWEPETMFKEGIKLTIKWFFENEEWMKNVTSGDYQKYYEEMYK